jgi:hypothetical protein
VTGCGIDSVYRSQVAEQAPPVRLFSEPSDERTRRFPRRVVDAGRL